MRISDWSSDVCSSDLRVRSVVSAIPRHSAPAGRTERGTSRGDDYDADPILNPDSVEDRRFRNPWDLSEVRTFSRSKAEVTQELRSRAFSAIEKMHGANDRSRENGRASCRERVGPSV